MIFIMRVLIFSLIPLLMFSGIFFSNSHAFASYESELDDFKIKLQELNELFSYHEFKLISENKQGNNAEGGIKKIVQSFYNDDIVFKSNIRLEISQFDSHQNAKNYFERHLYSTSEKYSDVNHSNNVCKQSKYENGDMRGQRGLCHIEYFVVKFNIEEVKDPTFARSLTDTLMSYLIESRTIENQIINSSHQNISVNIYTLFPNSNQIPSNWNPSKITTNLEIEQSSHVLNSKEITYMEGEGSFTNTVGILITELKSPDLANNLYSFLVDSSKNTLEKNSGVENLKIEKFLIDEEECTEIIYWKGYDWHAEIYCIRDNFSITIFAPDQIGGNQDAELFLSLLLDKFPPTQKLLEKQKLEHEKFLETQKLEHEKFLEQNKMLDNGEILKVEFIDKIELIGIILLEENNMDLLKINFEREFNEINGASDYPFGSLLANEKFTDEYDEWTKYQFLSTEDMTWLGTTISGSDVWDTTCPAYLGKGFNPNIPYDLIACFEIPKNVNYFKFEGLVFSRANISSSEISSSSDTKNGGGCLIATATYGSELAPQVQQLRELRDNQLLSTTSGTHFMNTFNSFYYSFSPIIADYERENPVFKEMVKVAITPMITSLSLMEYADSEESVVSIGISLILLNMMMYVGIPILAVMRFRK